MSVSAADRARRSGYMVCRSGFSCGNCAYLMERVEGRAPKTRDELHWCGHPLVQQPVDARLGCCNRFEPRNPRDRLVG